GTPRFENEQWRQSIHSFEAGKDIVVPFLKGKGITVIDKLILTHGDMDHAGGSFAVMKELKVRQILIPSVASPNSTLLKIVAEAQNLGIPVVRAEDGESWSSDRASFKIVSPKKDFVGTSNSGCIVMLAQIGGLNWLFTGDLDIEGEKRIMRSYPRLKVDILKVGHHGSKFSTSPEFLDQYHPKVALISVGENNHFGHPNQKVVKSLLQRNIAVYRTDKQGAITYQYFEDKGTFETVLP
ncbi:MAG: ComEC/Rec2 family competence protein, partial [Bacillota bacterium]|nr:ComEC/Rec2 family competence protein [Bacillota bacterium]